MTDSALNAEEKRRRAIEELKQQDEAVARVGEFLAGLNPKVYDIENDPQTKRIFQRILGIVEKDFPIGSNLKTPGSEKEFQKFVSDIIEQFRFLVENKGLWRLLWGEKETRLHENIAQTVFFAVAYSYCEGYNLHIAVEHDTGDGRSDFLFTLGRAFRVVVEIKWSDNPGLQRGYEKQVASYATSERAMHSYYVVLDCDEGKRFEKFQKYLDANKVRAPDISIVSIDANKKSSPSKPPL